jgi:hypothetical protein
MTFATDEELRKYPILHFDTGELSRLGRVLYTRAAGGNEVDVREQLDEIYESGLQAGADLADADRMEAFNDGLTQGLAEGKKKT